MPLESVKLPASLKKVIERKIKKLLAQDVFFGPTVETPYRAGFCLHMQVVPRGQVKSLQFGKPEGIRVLLENKNNVLAAVDFRKTPSGRLKISNIHQGKGLTKVLDTLNQLEKMLATAKQVWEPELIFFLLSPVPYIKIKSGKKVEFLKLEKGKIKKVTPISIKKEIATAVNSHQSS